MSNTLCNILVPVDFTTKNKWAITKAIEMANQMDCNIHLVNIVQSGWVSSFTPYESHVDRMNSYDQLKDLAVSYSNQLCGNGKIEISLLEGNPLNKLTEYIRDFEMDMVVMGLSGNLLQRVISSTSINKISRITNVPVLAVGSKGLVHHFKKIISEGLDIVHSVSTTPVHGMILEGDNLAKTTIDFAKRINGDLIMINPVEEFKLPGWWNKLTNKLLSYGSGIPVMTMSKQ